jgi:hypothetical protein
MRKRVTLLFAALVMALTMSFNGVAFAKIQSVDTSCTNGGGNRPGGQQPTCQGGGLTQQKGSIFKARACGISPSLSFCLIHPSVWKVDSPKFVR